MIQDKFHSVKTEQEKCSVFFALLGQSSPFILQEMGFLKNSTTYILDKMLVMLKKNWYNNHIIGALYMTAFFMVFLARKDRYLYSACSYVKI